MSILTIILNKLKLTIVDLDRKREAEVRKAQNQNESEIKKLNDTITRLKRNLNEQLKSEGRHSMAPGMFPKHALDKYQLIDSSKSNKGDTRWELLLNNIVTITFSLT